MNEQLNGGEGGASGAATAEAWSSAMNGETGRGSNIIPFPGTENVAAENQEPVQEQRSQDYYDSFGRDEDGNGMNVFDAQDAKHADAMEQYYTRLKRQQESFKGTKYEDDYSDSAIAKKLQAFDGKYRDQQGVNTAAVEASAGAAQPAETAQQPEQQGAQVPENQFGDTLEERDQDYEDYRRQAQEAEAEANGAETSAAEAERLQREQDNADVNALLDGFQEAEQPVAAQGDGAAAVAAQPEPQPYRMNGRRLDDIEAAGNPEARRLIEAQRAQEARETQVEAQNFKRDMDAFVAQSAKKYPRFISRFTVDFNDFWNRMLGRISGGHGSAA